MTKRALQHITPFSPARPDAAGVVSWVHIGDLHVTTSEEANVKDLRAIVAELGAAFEGSVSFVFLPGDNANEGSEEQYRIVRTELDPLRIPWFAVVGDHDVHEGALTNVVEWLAPEVTHAFDVGHVRGIALNAFDDDDGDPRAFAVGKAQLAWLDDELRAAGREGRECAVFVHCYPTDLTRGGAELGAILRARRVKLCEMGHTHYNELANDGCTVYATTRSTGQVEEGPVGFSVTNMDGGVVSWRFFELGALPAVMITSPCDFRLLRDDDQPARSHDQVEVRVKVWSDSDVVEVRASIGDIEVGLDRIPGSRVWTAHVPMPRGPSTLAVNARDARGRSGADEIALAHVDRTRMVRRERDQDNALDAWETRGILGTQLGPNKNGRAW